MTPTTEQLKDLLAKVTPGKWVADGLSKSGLPSAYINAADGYPVARAVGVVSEFETEANATLIALAPTLAAEVVRLRGALADMLFEYGGLYDKDCLVKDNHVLAMIDRARQALDVTSDERYPCSD